MPNSSTDPFRIEAYPDKDIQIKRKAVRDFLGVFRVDPGRLGDPFSLLHPVGGVPGGDGGEQK